MLEAILFDWDGTSADTGPHVFAFQQYICAARGMKCAVTNYADFRRKVYDPFPHYYQHVLGFDWEKDHGWIVDTFQEFMKGKYELHPFIQPLWQELQAMGIKVGIASSNLPSVINNKLSAEGITLPIVGYGPGIRSKPYPDSILACATIMGVQPAASLYVGDMPTDAEAAHAAGMRCALVGWGFKEPAALQVLHPDIFAERIEQLHRGILSQR
ncbi:HAD family hydrolase [Candidatus Woesearchaeota archaeon]|nr:HAD family hydrolase [Candidatus Woesearchaeota archaeon]